MSVPTMHGASGGGYMSKGMSKDFFELVKSIAESKSKQDEDKTILLESQNLKLKMKKSDLSSKKMKECLIRMIYVEMLGHDASWAHIHAVKMTSSSRKLMEKRVGYLAVSLCLHPDHELILLLVHTLQKDLGSDNVLEVAMALSGVCHLINLETAPALHPLILKLLTHPRALIRKKAVAALVRFYEIEPSFVIPTHLEKVKNALCDKDPSVMGCSLNIIHIISQNEPNLTKELVPHLVSILKQIMEHRLLKDYDYHRIPAPWIQIKILQILGMLGAADKHSSEGMYEVLHDVMKRADVPINVGFAIIYECVRTITSIYPNDDLIIEASTAISRFILSENHNLKYLGITALASIVQIDARFASEHQLTVIDCLENQDETLQRKTLDLLYEMTNSQNVIIVAEKLLSFLSNTTDTFLRQDLVSRITSLTEKYAPSTSWYIETMNLVFKLGSNYVNDRMAHRMMLLIAEAGESTNDEEEEDIRVYAAETYLELLNINDIPHILMQVVAWVIGEFGHLTSIPREELIKRLLEAYYNSKTEPQSRSWLLTAIMKHCAYLNHLPEEVNTLVQRYKSSLSLDIQQRCYEFNELLKTPSIMKEFLPLNSYTDDFEVDEHLTCVNEFVSEALANGANEYHLPTTTTDYDGTNSDQDENILESSTLNFTPYAAPLHGTAMENRLVESSPTVSLKNKEIPEDTLHTSGIKRLWGPDGFLEEETTSNKREETNIYDVEEEEEEEEEREEQREEREVQQQQQQIEEDEESEDSESERKQVMSEKEIFAAALFGGLTTTTTTNIKSKKQQQSIKTSESSKSKKKYNRKRNIQQKQQQQQEEETKVNSTKTITNNESSAITDSTVDLLDMDDFFSTPVIQQETSSTTTNIDVMPPTTTSNSSSSASLFDDMFLNSSSSSSSSNIVIETKVSDLDFDQQIGGNLQRRLENIPHGHSIQQIFGDSQLSVRIHSILDENYTSLVFTFIVHSTDISDLKLNLFDLLKESISYNYEIYTINNSNETTKTLLPSNACIPLSTSSSNSLILSMNCIKPPYSITNITGEITYSTTSFSNNTIQIQFPMMYLDFMRPSRINVDLFGTLWQSHTSEAKSKIKPTSCSSSKEFMKRCEKQANFYPIQTIQKENVACAYLVCGNNNTSIIYILLHGKVKSSSIDILIHSSDSNLTKAVIEDISKIMK